nr:MAG TPA: hypothetical protein [Bacteriophage sp.]DAH04155.1 MAG TPA: hypothetical protein [Caudoviricetes sp.]
MLHCSSTLQMFSSCKAVLVGLPALYEVLYLDIHLILFHLPDHPE